VARRISTSWLRPAINVPLSANAIRGPQARLLAPIVPVVTMPNRQLHQSTNDKSQSSSTEAITFKNRLRRKNLPFNSFAPRITQSAEEAVTNILYNTPAPSAEPDQRHVLNCLVQNEPGVLSRVSGILAGRGFNIDSLVVASTEVRDLSRMTIVFRGKNAIIEQARKQLEDLVPVWAVLDYSRTKLVERELLLIKVSILGPEHLHEQLATTASGVDVEYTDEILGGEENAAKHEGFGEVDFHERRVVTPSAMLRQTFAHLRALTELTRLFGGRVLDVSSDCVILELSAKPSRVESFVKLVKPFGILEAARSGMMAMPRSPVLDHYEPQQDHAYEKSDEGRVDATMLPPG